MRKSLLQSQEHTAFLDLAGIGAQAGGFLIQCVEFVNVRLTVFGADLGDGNVIGLDSKPGGSESAFSPESF